MTTTQSQSRNLKISCFKTTTPTKVDTIKNKFFQDHHILQKVETIKDHFFQDHHTIPR